MAIYASRPLSKPNAADQARLLAVACIQVGSSLDQHLGDVGMIFEGHAVKCRLAIIVLRVYINTVLNQQFDAIGKPFVSGDMYGGPSHL